MEIEQKNKFQVLDWDSEFFGFEVAKLQTNLLKEDEQSSVFEDLLKNNVELIYYYCDAPLSENLKISGYKGLLVDKKIPLKKSLKVAKEISPNIRFYNKKTPCEKLVSLAQLAGIHTRFKIDPHISEEKYNELFKTWIRKSLNGEMASAVLVYEIEGKIVGFGTAQVLGEEGRAPLFAVDREYEGKGISFALMKALESYMAEKGCQYVLTSTQDTNKKAMKIYERYGLEALQPVYVYHFWKNRTT